MTVLLTNVIYKRIIIGQAYMSDDIIYQNNNVYRC